MHTLINLCRQQSIWRSTFLSDPPNVVQISRNVHNFVCESKWLCSGRPMVGQEQADVSYAPSFLDDLWSQKPCSNEDNARSHVHVFRESGGSKGFHPNSNLFDWSWNHIYRNIYISNWERVRLSDTPSISGQRAKMIVISECVLCIFVLFSTEPMSRCLVRVFGITIVAFYLFTMRSGKSLIGYILVI